MPEYLPTWRLRPSWFRSWSYLKPTPVLPPRMETMRLSDVVWCCLLGFIPNGYSLYKIVELSGLGFEVHVLSIYSVVSGLLTPTRIYVKPILACTKSKKLKGMAHRGGLLQKTFLGPSSHLSHLIRCVIGLHPYFTCQRKWVVWWRRVCTFNCGIRRFLVLWVGTTGDMGKILNFLNRQSVFSWLEVLLSGRGLNRLRIKIWQVHGEFEDIFVMILI
jgi:hypothetical protein